MKILIIDDAVTFRKLLCMTLESIGLQDIVQAGCAEDARNVLLNGTYVDLIICDWHMPGETGLEFLKWLRGQSNLSKTPFIMLTTEQERSHILEAARVGIQGYIFKPVQKAMLMQKLVEIGILPKPE
jgi:two-component system, chemotaxis family, chemotaxis protein CheY